MEDSPNEVQNIASPTKIDEVDEPKTVEANVISCGRLESLKKIRF